jgi:hypothetical protein
VTGGSHYCALINAHQLADRSCMATIGATRHQTSNIWLVHFADCSVMKEHLAKRADDARESIDRQRYSRGRRELKR